VIELYCILRFRQTGHEHLFKSHKRTRRKSHQLLSVFPLSNVRRLQREFSPADSLAYSRCKRVRVHLKPRRSRVWYTRRQQWRWQEHPSLSSGATGGGSDARRVALWVTLTARPGDSGCMGVFQSDDHSAEETMRIPRLLPSSPRRLRLAKH
jgi:hypothetical protein